jgi:hypothetical protein
MLAILRQALGERIIYFTSFVRSYKIFIFCVAKFGHKMF